MASKQWQAGKLSASSIEQLPPMMCFDPEPPLVVFDFDQTLSQQHTEVSHSLIMN